MYNLSKIHLVTGYARSGKNVFASFLKRKYGFRNYAYADNIRKYIILMNPRLTSEYNLENILGASRGLWDDLKEHQDPVIRNEVRRLLQAAGEGAREVFGDRVWIDALAKQIKEDLSKPFIRLRGEPSDKIVISDLRHIREVVVAKNEWQDDETDIYIGRILRVGQNDGDQNLDKHLRSHITETEQLMIREDYTIVLDYDMHNRKEKSLDAQIARQIKHQGLEDLF